jgi:hypothetical protein
MLLKDLTCGSVLLRDTPDGLWCPLPAGLTLDAAAGATIHGPPLLRRPRLTADLTADQ